MPYLFSTRHIRGERYLQALAGFGDKPDGQTQGCELVVGHGQSDLHLVGSEGAAQWRPRRDILPQIDIGRRDATAEGQGYAGSLEIDAGLFEIGLGGFQQCPRLGNLGLLESEV